METTLRRAVRDGLELLGVRRFLLGIHDPAFPMSAHEDVGRGSPYSDAAHEVLALASELGFDGLQLGPQGATSPVDPSPYDGTIFSRDPLSVALAPLTRPEWGALLPARALEDRIAARPAAGAAVREHAFRAVPGALRLAFTQFRERVDRGEPFAADLAQRLAAFRAAHAAWLERDALYEVLEAQRGGAAWMEWPAAERALCSPAPGEEATTAERWRALLARHAGEVDAYAFVQLLASEQHRAFRQRARALGLTLFGDLQVGLSVRDTWAARGFLLRGWRMGAPPSRTDPGGQPWGFPVLDPRLQREPGTSGEREGPVLRFIRARARHTFAHYDGVRVDHPHGFVCPWVYRAVGDPAEAVQNGARLFESPSSPEHPDLAAFAIARPEQLDLTRPRHADDWVTQLDDAQVDRYAAQLEAVLEAAPDRRDVACEILSTMPYPLRRVVERNGLGRFRVTQKASPDDRADVYRGENARPEDWIMLGNHDTAPIWTVAERWVESGAGARHAAYLATRLLPEGADRAAWARAIAGDAGALAQARFADLFVGPARHVMVYFTDLFGAGQPYNRPGTVSDVNWSQRLPADVRAHYRRRVIGRRALDVPRAIAGALRSRGADFIRTHAALLSALDAADPAGD